MARALVTDRQTDRRTDGQTDGKRRIRAHRALAQVGSINEKKDALALTHLPLPVIHCPFA